MSFTAQKMIFIFFSLNLSHFCYISVDMNKIRIYITIKINIFVFYLYTHLDSNIFFLHAVISSYLSLFLKNSASDAITY